MEKLKVKIIIIGHADRIVDFQIIQKYNSKFFECSDLEHIYILPNCQKNDGYLDNVYSKPELIKLLENIQFDGICIAVMNYRFDDNFYMHRLDGNKLCISIAGIEEILLRKSISIENFILKNLYEAFIFYKIFNNLVNDEVYNFVHHDTRGCLFDLNGDKSDIIYNTESPIICEECQSKINTKSVPKGFIKSIQNELQKIHKPWIKSIEIFIKKYPLASILATFVFSTLINLISNVIWDVIKKFC